MKPAFNSRRLDVAAFARQAGVLETSEPLSGYARLLDLVAGRTDGLLVQARVRGEARTRLGGAPELWLHLTVQAVVPLLCQRCLGPVEVPIVVDRWFRFVENEVVAERLDAEIEEDVLVQVPDFDLRGLIEDEVLLALPIVPRHEHCPVEVPLSAVDAGFEAALETRSRPFDALASLVAKKRPG